MGVQKSAGVLENDWKRSPDKYKMEFREVCVAEILNNGGLAEKIVLKGPRNCPTNRLFTQTK